MGNFSSKPFSSGTGDSLRAYQKSFEALSQVLVRHPTTLERSKIIIVPGEADPGNGVYPQPPLSDMLVRGLGTRFANVVLATNPCRIRFHNKHITLFSGNVVEGLRRNKLVANYDSSQEDEGEKVATSHPAPFGAAP
jgi:DNA polymerase epsilon subunit 2